MKNHIIKSIHKYFTAIVTAWLNIYGGMDQNGVRSLGLAFHYFSINKGDRKNFAKGQRASTRKQFHLLMTYEFSFRCCAVQDNKQLSAITSASWAEVSRERRS